MKQLKFLAISFCLLAWSFDGMADKGDTAKAKKPSPIAHYYTESMLAPYNLWVQNRWSKRQTVDTNLQNLQYYTSHYNLGNTGLPYVPITFDNALQPIGFFYGNDYISNNFYSDSNVKYFDARAPYTQFYYVTDPQIHQYFRLSHTQNIGKHFNFYIGWKRIRSEGIYLNQSTNNNQLLLSMNYHVKRYLLLTDAMYDVYKFQQNGGIPSDTFLPSPLYTQRLTIPVNLNYANTEMLERSFHIKQYYFFGYRKMDSLKENPLFYVSHSLRIAGHSNVYSDQDTADEHFYSTFNHDSLTYDSLRYVEVSNDLSIGSGKGSHTFLKWEAGMTEQYIHFKDFVSVPNGDETYINQKMTDTVFNNFIAHGRLYNAFDSGKIMFDASGQYIVEGNLQGNMQYLVQAGVKFDSLHFLKLSGTYSSQAPPFIYDLYQGNNFNWVNQLPNVNTSSLCLNYWDNKWHLDISLQATQITNMVYFDSAAQPLQYHPAINVYCATFTKDFKVLHFHLNTTEKFQYVAFANTPYPGTTLPLRLPRLVAENSVYYEGYLFRKHLLLRVGADIWYNTAYYGYSYMPVFDQYYQENSQKLGNYTYIDPFVSFRIMTFRMFVKYENATMGLVPYNYYYALHYPMTDATIRFGISWDFWN